MAQPKAKSNALMMMLKSFGIDPEQMIQQAQQLIGEVKEQQQATLDALAEINKKLEEISKCLKEKEERQR